METQRGNVGILVASFFAAAVLFGGFLFLISSAHASSGVLSGTPLYTDASLVSYYPMQGNSNDAKGSNSGTDSSTSEAKANSARAEDLPGSANGFDVNCEFHFFDSPDKLILIHFNHRSSIINNTN